MSFRPKLEGLAFSPTAHPTGERQAMHAMGQTQEVADLEPTMVFAPATKGVANSYEHLKSIL